MNKLRKNNWIGKLLVILVSFPMYLFVLIGEFYEKGFSHFSFVAVTVTFWLEVVSVVIDKDLSLISYKVDRKQSAKKEVNREIRQLKKNSTISEEYKDRLLKILIEAKKLGYGIYDTYFENGGNWGKFSITFRDFNSYYSTLPEFEIDPDSRLVVVYDSSEDIYRRLDKNDLVDSTIFRYIEEEWQT